MPKLKQGNEVMYEAPTRHQPSISTADSEPIQCDTDTSKPRVYKYESISRFAVEEAKVMDAIRPLSPDQSIVPFAATRFFGSKRKQLGWIAAELQKFNGATVLDAFGGTGAVTHALAAAGWRVTYNDIFEFNNVCARAIFNTSADTIHEHEFIRILDSVEPLIGFISQTFDGIFFHPTENAWLDGFLDQVSHITGGSRDVLLYCLFQACLMKRPFNLFHRDNLNLRRSSVPVKFGNRTTWNRLFRELMLRSFRELTQLKMSINYNKVTVATRMCASQVTGEFDLVYLDPPYFKQTKRNTDSYLQRYHFLEGIARFEDWPNMIDASSPIKIMQAKDTTEWTDKTTLIGNVEDLIRRFEKSNFMLSYVAGEAPSESEWYSLFNKYFSKVRLIQRPFGKALSKKSSFEFLLVGLR